MTPTLAAHLSTYWTIAAIFLVALGAAIQVAVGAGLSVVCGAFLLLTLGPTLAVSVLLILNLLVSLVATAAAPRLILWRDVAIVSVAALSGSLAAKAMPAVPGSMIKPITACMLIVIAFRRPSSGKGDRVTGTLASVGFGGFISGLLTVWTATPGPIVPVTLSQAGRTGDEIRRTMQPISIVGYGIGIACVSISNTTGALQWAGLPLLSAGVLAGCAVGLCVRRFVRSSLVVVIVRSIALFAAVTLLGSWLNELAN